MRWSKRRGARVIATVGSEVKASLARQHGADAVIVGRNADFEKEVAALTDGGGVDVAYDGIGGTTLLKTLGCVRPFGMVASFGEAGGPILSLSVSELGPRRSISLCRLSVMHYMSDPARYRKAATEVMAAVESGLQPSLGRAYRLVEAGRAQQDLESGSTTGSPYLIP